MHAESAFDLEDQRYRSGSQATTSFVALDIGRRTPHLLDVLDFRQDDRVKSGPDDGVQVVGKQAGRCAIGANVYSRGRVRIGGHSSVVYHAGHQ